LENEKVTSDLKTYQRAKRLTLDFLRWWMARLPADQRRKPVLVFDAKTWSVVDMISQIQMDTEIGRRYVYYYTTIIQNVKTKQKYKSYL
jgi:hypothetical protein